MYSGPGSGSLAASAAAWQALSAEMGSAGAAYGAVISALVSGAWLGPSSISMALAAAPYVVWMLATATQCQVAAVAAGEAATAFEAARAGVIPPPVIAANRSLLATLVGTNFMGFNSGAIAATQADYMEMWGQNASVLYNYSADLAGDSATVTPFLPPPPTTNPAGLAGQAASVGESGATNAGQQAVKLAGTTTSDVAAMPAGMDAQSMMTMGPQLISTVPQALQGLSSPLSSVTSGGGLGQFQSLLSPFMSMMSNPGMLGGMSPGAASSLTGSSLTGATTAGSGVEALAGRAGSLGGLSVPATWTAGGGQSETAVETAKPVAAPRGVTTGATSAVPATATGTGGMYGGAPMAAGMGGRGGSGDGPRYGTPVKVIERR